MVLYTDGKTIGPLSAFVGVVTSVFPVVTVTGADRYYTPDNGRTWFSWNGTTWVIAVVAPVGYRYFDEACAQGPVCNCGGGLNGNVPLSNPGSQVSCEAVCIPPQAEPYVCTFQPCEPKIFKDCRHTLLYKDPYGGWKYCKPGASAWADAEFQVCPTDLVSLRYSPSLGTYWQRESGGAASYYDVESGAWLENNNPPCDLRDVYINLRTGKLFYYKVCRESDLRTVPAIQPFCSTGY